MDRDEMEQAATNLISEHLGVAREKVVRDSDFRDDLGADSLDVIELVMAFEEEFDREITDDEADKIRTVGDAFDLIAGKLAA